MPTVKKIQHNDHVPVSIISTTQNIYIQPARQVKQPRFQRFGGAAPFSLNSAAPDSFLEKKSDTFYPNSSCVEMPPLPKLPFEDDSDIGYEEQKIIKNNKKPSWAASSPKKDKGYIVKYQSNNAVNVITGNNQSPVKKSTTMPIEKVPNSKPKPPLPKSQKALQKSKRNLDKRSHSQAPIKTSNSEYFYGFYAYFD